MSIQELRKEQARNLRYKKPIAKGLNWQDIWDDLYEMYEGCTLVIWFMDDDKETLLESLNDDESEVEEYKIAFSTLEADCDQLMAALQEEWIPECFNLFFVAAQAGIILVMIFLSVIISESTEKRPGRRMWQKKSSCVLPKRN